MAESKPEPDRTIRTDPDINAYQGYIPDDWGERVISPILHNLLTSTLHELERLQAPREGEAVPLPAVADVNVTVDSRVA